MRARSTWQGVANQLSAAARGADPADVTVALQLVLILEKVEFRPAQIKGRPRPTIVDSGQGRPWPNEKRRPRWTEMSHNGA